MQKKNPKNINLAGKQEYTVSSSNSEWVLFHNNFSLCSRKVRVCLEEYKIDYHPIHIHILETKDSENLTPEFLKVNPKATVPVLLHKNYPIYESHEQIEYLTSRYLNDSNTSESVNEWNRRGSLVGDDLIKGTRDYAGNCVALLTQPLFIAMLKKINFSKFLKYFINHPSKFRAFNFTIYKVLGFSVFRVNSPHQKIALKAINHLNLHLSDLNDHLEAKKWIAGDTFSLADITWMAILHRLEELQLIDKLLINKENLKKYYSSLKERESFTESILKFNHPSVEMGINRLKKEILTNKNLKSLYSSI